ncbi:unnamed protein product [Durusdinium trenchii]|uniref:Uncharacterized protein n=1 Tax=Durusdinium trenchii TaxID=1381693 RepID=A0ABP0SJ00_9DINO
MFILEPSSSKFQKLRQLLKKAQPNLGFGGIQYFLNHAFPAGSVHHADSVGCWKGEFSDEFNKFTRDVDDRKLNANQYASLHYSGDWGGQRKPWMSGCLESSDSVTHEATLQKKLLGIWIDAFHSVSAPSDMSDLLHTDCPAEFDDF